MRYECDWNTLAPHGAVELREHDLSESARHSLVTVRPKTSGPGGNANPPNPAGVTLTNEEVGALVAWWAGRQQPEPKAEDGAD